MNTLNKSLIALVALHCTGTLFAAREEWKSDFTAAKKLAAESKQDLLMDFTGSDWCGWCIKLDKEVFSQDAFKAGVKDKFVLVEVDFPKDKSKLSADTLKQNTELGGKYAIEGYPTILLCDAEGRPFGKTGYQAGGPEAYVKHLNELHAAKDVRDKAFAEAAKAEGVVKAKALVAALGAMGLEDSVVANFYGEVVAQIKAADPKDETGYAKAAGAKERSMAFQEKLQELAQKGDFDGAMVFVDTTLKEGGFGEEDTQQMMMVRVMIFAQQKKFDEALKAADEAKAFAPNSKISANIDGLKARLEAGKKQGGADEPAKEK